MERRGKAGSQERTKDLIHGKPLEGFFSMGIIQFDLYFEGLRKSCCPMNEESTVQQRCRLKSGITGEPWSVH